MAQMLVDQVNQEFAAAPGSSDGTLVGRNATTPVGFYGQVPVVQPTWSTGAGTVQTLATALASMGLIKLVA